MSRPAASQHTLTQAESKYFAANRKDRVINLAITHLESWCEVENIYIVQEWEILSIQFQEFKERIVTM